MLHKSCIFRSLFSFFMIKKDRNIAQFLYRCFIEGNVVKCMKHFGQVWLGYIIRIKLHIKQAPCCLFCSLLGLSCEIKDNRNTANCLTTSRAGGLDLRTLLVHKSRRSAMQQRGGLIDTQTHREKGILKGALITQKLHAETGVQHTQKGCSHTERVFSHKRVPYTQTHVA